MPSARNHNIYGHSNSRGIAIGPGTQLHPFRLGNIFGAAQQACYIVMHVINRHTDRFSDGGYSVGVTR